MDSDLSRVLAALDLVNAASEKLKEAHGLIAGIDAEKGSGVEGAMSALNLSAMNARSLAVGLCSRLAK